MPLIRLASLVLLVTSLAIAPARAATPLEYFDPASDWVLDYAESSCALRRAYSDDAGRIVYVDMRQYHPNSPVTFTIYSADVERSPEEVRYRFNPDEDNRDAGFAFALDFGEDMRGFRFLGDYLRKDDRPDDIEEFDALDPSVFVAREAEVTSMVVLEGFEQSILLRTGSLAAPMEAMRVCLDELLVHWGLDAEVHRTLSRRVELKNERGFGQDLGADFPRQLRRDGGAASMRVRLLVDAEGAVTDCSIYSMVGEASVGDIACETFSRYARFDPALDAEGNPVASFWTTDLTYWTR